MQAVNKNGIYYGGYMNGIATTPKAHKDDAFKTYKKEEKMSENIFEFKGRDSF